MATIDGMDGYVKVMFGCHAMQAACQLILQRGKQLPNGKHMTVVVGLLVTDEDPFSDMANERNAVHELVVGDLVIRPHGKWAGSNHAGDGITAMLKDDAMFPEGHEYQTLDNGYRGSAIGKMV